MLAARSMGVSSADFGERETILMKSLRRSSAAAAAAAFLSCAQYASAIFAPKCLFLCTFDIRASRTTNRLSIRRYTRSGEQSSPSWDVNISNTRRWWRRTKAAWLSTWLCPWTFLHIEVDAASIARKS